MCRLLRAAAGGLTLQWLLLSGGVHAGPLEDGVAAYMRRDFEQARKLLVAPAKAGHPYAQLLVGELYYFGRSVPEDHKEAREWFLRSAKQGQPRAQFALGLMLEKGRGGSQDWYGAAEWYRAAANKGHCAAANNLGLIYGRGNGVPVNDVQAYKWFAISIARCVDPSDADTRASAQQNLNHVSTRMRPDDVAKAKQIVADWKPQR